MAQVYSDAAYNTDGYWLLAEEYLASKPSIIPALQSSITLKTALFGNAITSTTLAGGIYSTIPLGSTVNIQPILNGNIYSTMLMGGSNIVCNPSLSSSIRLDMFVESHAASSSSASGFIGMDMSLMAGANISPILSGNIYSTLLLAGAGTMVPSLTARLTFPSIYIGDLGIESLTPVNAIESLTPVHQIGLH